MAFTYVNVLANPDELKAMLKWSKGKRNVPVVVDGDTVTIGWGGES